MRQEDVDKWITRQELAERYGVPVKTPAEWASKGTGPRYARFGRHVRYRLGDVIDWERTRLIEPQPTAVGDGAGPAVSCGETV